MRIILSLLLSLIATPLFGQVDGRGIFCDLNTAKVEALNAIKENGILSGVDPKEMKIGFFFKEGLAFSVSPQIRNDVAFYVKSSFGDKYQVDANNITWDDAVLDRKTLILISNNVGKLQCEVFASQISFDKETDRLQEKLQSLYEVQLEGNKI